MSVRRRERTGMHKVTYFTRFEAAGTQGKGGAGGYVGPPRASSNGRGNWILHETSFTFGFRDVRNMHFG